MHPETEHGLMIEAARLRRERDEALQRNGVLGLELMKEKARADAAEAELAKHEGCLEETQKAFDESLDQCLDRAEKAEEALAPAPSAAEKRIAELEARLNDAHEAIRWACGEKPLKDGRWFDYREFGHADNAALPFWWRAILRLYSGVDAALASPGAAGEETHKP